MRPIRQPRVVTTRLLRPADLLDLLVTAEGAKLSTQGDATALVVGEKPGTLTVEFAFQHLGEQAYPEAGGNPGGSDAAPEPTGLANHRAAHNSRLVYELPADSEIPWTVEGVLSALTTLRLKVVPLATPGPGHYPEDGSPSSAPGGAVIMPRPIGSTLEIAGHVRLARSLTRPGVVSAQVVLPPGEMFEPLYPWPTFKPRPRAPRQDETALEVPYRLVVSPSAEHGVFVHDVAPVGPDQNRVELWRTRLSTRTVTENGEFVGHTDGGVQRVVRAVWSPDMELFEPPDAAPDTDVTLMSLNPVDRRSLVRQSSSTHEGVSPMPLRVNRLSLSALGAWVDWRGAWDTQDYGAPSGWPGTVTDVSSYRHEAQMGRDSYVRVTYPGFLFPFGHRCVWVKLTERKVDEKRQTAYLRQRQFIVLQETTRSWADRDTPLTQVTLSPSVTPDLDQPPTAPPAAPYFPNRTGSPFAWDVLGVDRAGDPVSLSAPLLFVPDGALKAGPLAEMDPDEAAAAISEAYADHSTITVGGQQVSFAATAAHGDTQLEVNTLTWDGHADTEAFTSRPFMTSTNAAVPALRHIAGQSPGVKLEYVDAYLANDPKAGDTPSESGFGPVNPGGLFLRLADVPVPLDFTAGSDHGGGFVAPNQMVRALSRSLGAVGDDGTNAAGLASATFDPATFLEGAQSKLFGLFSLAELIEAATDGALPLTDAPSIVTDSLDTISAIDAQVERLQQAIGDAQQRLQNDLAAAADAHQGASNAVVGVQAELKNAADALLPQLEALGTALANLVMQPAAAAAATSAVAVLAPGLESSLRPVITHPRLPAALRSQLGKPLDALSSLLSVGDVQKAIDEFVEGRLTAPDGVSARFEWRPPIGSWPSAQAPVFCAKDPNGFSLAVEVRASAQGAASTDISAELRDFALVLLPGTPLLAMNFSRIGFRVGSTIKPEVDVVFGGLEFLGELGFVETLRRMIPFDGFADPPYVDVTPSGVTAGFDLELPNISVGMFSLENVALGADARVPFLGDAVTVGFNFCSKQSPFRLTVMCIGGGGWVALRLSPQGMVALEVGLEAVACLSVNLGVASGSVSVSVGIYLRLEGDSGSLTGYFRIRGQVDVLGLISASITLELSLHYDFDTGKMIGRASVVVEIDILFFSASVEVSCERQLAGSKGDPVLRDIMPPDADGHSNDWSRYCGAFAPGA